jgi:hypothetical protein
MNAKRTEDGASSTYCMNASKSTNTLHWQGWPPPPCTGQGDRQDAVRGLAAP